MQSLSATEVISGIVTPAILILGTSSLITATANRQSRLLERVRELTKEIEALSPAKGDKYEFLISQLRKATSRTRLVQRALVNLYLSLGGLIFTSVGVGISAVAGLATAGAILALIFISLAFLFYASVLLIRESKIALAAVDAEMDYVKRLA